MSTQVLGALVRKDLYLHRQLSIAALAASILSLGLLASGGELRFYMGGVLLVTTMIGHGATLIILSVTEERQNRTLPFVMSLPVSTRQYALSKVLSNLAGFGVTWLVLLSGTVGLILLSDTLPDGLVIYALLVAIEILAGLCLMLSVAMVTQSLPWSLATMIVANLFFNGFIFALFRTPAFVSGAQSPTVVWPPDVVALLLFGVVGIGLLLWIGYAGSIRRKDVL